MNIKLKALIIITIILLSVTITEAKHFSTLNKNNGKIKTTHRNNGIGNPPPHRSYVTDEQVHGIGYSYLNYI